MLVATVSVVGAILCFSIFMIHLFIELLRGKRSVYPTPQTSRQRRLHYAARYLRVGEGRDSKEVERFFSWLSSFDETNIMSIGPTRVTGVVRYRYLDDLPVDIGTPEFYYWEVSIHGSLAAKRKSIRICSKTIRIGFERQRSKIMYCSDGKVLQNSHEIMTIEPYTGGDVVGCGLVNHGGSVFFTKNGKRVVSVGAPLYGIWWHPTVTLGVQWPKGDEIVANFGKQPFSFDIEAYCDAIDAAGGLGGHLQLEVLDRIFTHALGSTARGLENYRVIYKLAQVSKYYYKLCSSRMLEELVLLSRTEMSAAEGLRLIPSSRTLITKEDDAHPWLHGFLVRLFPQRESRLTYWDCNFDLHAPREPLDLSTCIRSNNWTTISSLEIRNRSFRIWGTFARLVFSLPQVEELRIQGVSWGDVDSIATPPSWLKFRRRLRSVHFDGGERIALGCTWLLIAGTPGRDGSELPLHKLDIPVVANIMRVLADLFPESNHITYAPVDDGTYRMVVFRDVDSSQTPASEIVFARSQGRLELSEVQISCQANYPLQSYPRSLAALIIRLSNSETVTVRFVIEHEYEADIEAARRESILQAMPELHARGGLYVAMEYTEEGRPPYPPSPPIPVIPFKEEEGWNDSGIDFMAYDYGSNDVGMDSHSMDTQIGQSDFDFASSNSTTFAWG